MTSEDINRICTQYLNDCESELEVLDVFDLADEALNYKSAIEDIKWEIDLRATSRQNGKWLIAKDEVFDIIDKHLKGESK